MYAGAYTDPTPSPRSGLAYAELKRRLLMGDFALNMRLGEERLASLLGVSRTPVREALLRLHAEGLLGRSPDGGYCPVAPDVTDMRHLYEVRSGLELHALGRPTRLGLSHDLGILEELRDDWRSLGDAAADDEAPVDPNFVFLDESFHVTLAESSGNGVLADLLRQINDRIRIVRMQDFLTVDRIRLTVEQHLGIVEVVLSGDLVEAERRFTSHLDESMAVVEQRVSAAVARMIRQQMERT